MKRQFAMALVAIMVVSVLTAMPVMSGLEDENATNLNKTNENITAENVYLRVGGRIIATTIVTQANVSELELLISIAAKAKGDLVGKIAFSSDMDGDQEIYVMVADGTNVTQLTYNTKANDVNPEWYPYCKKIAFASDRDGDSEIYVMEADATNVTQLTRNTHYDGSQVWSPDGSKIAFDSDRDGDSEIYVMDADGTNVVKLTSNTAVDEWFPFWSPDGSKIAFSSDRDGDWEIYVMNVDGKCATINI